MAQVEESERHSKNDLFFQLYIDDVQKPTYSDNVTYNLDIRKGEHLEKLKREPHPQTNKYIDTACRKDTERGEQYLQT